MIRANFNRPVGAGTEVMRCWVGLVLRVKVQEVRWWNLNVCSEKLFWISFCIGFYLSTESLIDSLINSHCVVIGCFETQHHYTA